MYSGVYKYLYLHVFIVKNGVCMCVSVVHVLRLRPVVFVHFFLLSSTCRSIP